MKHCILLLAVVCAGASFTSATKESLTFFSATKEAVPGVNWVGQMCNTADFLCHRPLSLALTATGLAALWALITIVKAIFD